MRVKSIEEMSVEEKRDFFYRRCDLGNCSSCLLNTTEGCKNIAEMTESELNDAMYRYYGEESETVQKHPVIKDSGERREFETGAKRDMAAGKGRMDLLPWAAIMEVSKHCENGAAKYGEHNVDKGIPTHSFCDSAARHLAKYLDGWDDEPHLLAAAWNLLWAIQMEIKHPEMVDTPWKQEGKEND